VLVHSPRPPNQKRSSFGMLVETSRHQLNVPIAHCYQDLCFYNHENRKLFPGNTHTHTCTHTHTHTPTHRDSVTASVCLMFCLAGFKSSKSHFSNSSQDLTCCHKSCLGFGLGRRCLVWDGLHCASVPHEHVAEGEDERLSPRGVLKQRTGSAAADVCESFEETVIVNARWRINKSTSGLQTAVQNQKGMFLISFNILCSHLFGFASLCYVICCSTKVILGVILRKYAAMLTHCRCCSVFTWI